MYYKCHKCGLVFDNDECTTYTDYKDGIVCPACGTERADTNDVIEEFDNNDKEILERKEMNEVIDKIN